MVTFETWLAVELKLCTLALVLGRQRSGFSHAGVIEEEKEDDEGVGVDKEILEEVEESLEVLT